MSEQEKAAHVLLMEQFVQRGVRVTHEKTIRYDSKFGRPRWRNVDLVVHLASGDVWLEIDGLNHRGQKNVRRDQTLLALSIRDKAKLLHWPILRLMEYGTEELFAAVMAGNTHHGHADARPYTVNSRKKILGYLHRR